MLHSINFNYSNDNLSEIINKIDESILLICDSNLLNYDLRTASNQILIHINELIDPSYNKRTLISDYLSFKFKDVDDFSKTYYKIINLSSIGSTPQIQICFYKGW